MDRRCVRSSLTCCHREAWVESLECPLSATTLPSEVPTLSGRGAWAGVGGTITFGSEVLGRWLGVGLGLDMVEAPLQGRLLMRKCLPPRLGWTLEEHSCPQMSSFGDGVLAISEHSDVPYLPRCGRTGRVVLAGVH